MDWGVKHWGIIKPGEPNHNPDHCDTQLLNISFIHPLGQFTIDNTIKRAHTAQHGARAGYTIKLWHNIEPEQDIP